MRLFHWTYYYIALQVTQNHNDSKSKNKLALENLLTNRDEIHFHQDKFPST